MERRPNTTTKRNHQGLARPTDGLFITSAQFSYNAKTQLINTSLGGIILSVSQDIDCSLEFSWTCDHRRIVTFCFFVRVINTLTYFTYLLTSWLFRDLLPVRGDWA